MNYFNRISFIFVSLFFCSVFTSKPRNILFNEFKDKIKSFDDLSVWRNKIRDDFKQQILKFSENSKKLIVEKADEVLNSKWDVLLANEYLEFKKNGNRDHFQSKNYQRREKLKHLVLAEVLTQKGKYLNEIANGLWLILEESTWTWPAHLGMQKAGIGLPDPNQFVIDLGAGETSAIIAWVRLLMGESYVTEVSKIFNSFYLLEINYKQRNS